MKELYVALGLLLVGFITLEMRATRDPYDYRRALMTDPTDKESLSHAMEKALRMEPTGTAPASTAPARTAPVVPVQMQPPAKALPKRLK